MGQNGDFAFLPIPSNTKNIVQNGQISMDFRKNFRKKKLFLENRRKLTPQKYIHPSGISRGRFVYSFDKPKVFGLPGIIFFSETWYFCNMLAFLDNLAQKQLNEITN